MDREWRTCAWMQNNAFPTASMPRSLPPLLVLTSERAPRPWSTRCRCCRWLSPQATSLDEARLAVALHSCPPTGAERSQATAAAEHARRLPPLATALNDRRPHTALDGLTPMAILANNARGNTASRLAG